MSEKLTPRENEKLAQSAIRCYLSTLLAVSDSMAEACPEVGMPFKRRWARAPQRIGFEPTQAAIEESAKAFDRDVRAFGAYVSHFFTPAVPLVTGIADRGTGAVDGVLDGLASHSVMLETLAESIAATADLEDAPPEIRAALEHQAAGLLNCARKVEQDVLPRIAELQNLFRGCKEVAGKAGMLLMADPESGLLNRFGFEKEWERRRLDGSLATLLRLRASAKLKAGADCTDEQFAEILKSLAGLVFEQFRANESIAICGREFLVLFGGTVAQASGRQQDIERRLSGVYKVGNVKVDVSVTMEVSDATTAPIPQETPQAGAPESEPVTA